MVTTTSTEPALDDVNWSLTPVEVLIDNTEAHTYYVWAKDGVNISHETINTYLLTKTEGTGTTLTIKYNNSTGAELTTGYVLDGTKVYVEASAETGYSSLTITNNETNIANQSIQTVSSATTIRSNAVASTYIVNYDSNGGTGTMPAQIMLYGVQRKLTKNTFTKVGYSFIGWNTMDDGTGINYSDEESVVDIASPATSNMVTLYAKWKAEAVFDTGINVNVKIKQLAGDTSPEYNTDNTSITSIVKSTTEPSAANKTTEHIVSDNTLSGTPIYMWYDNGTIYWWSEDDTPSFNSNSSQMFRQLLNLTNIDLSNFDTSNVTDMSWMFFWSSSITNLDISNFNTSNVTDMSFMFFGCSSITNLNISNFNTSKVTNMRAMFQSNSALTNITFGNNFDTSNVTDMSWMFFGCSSITNLDISNFNTSNVTDMSFMFYNNTSLTSIDLSNFDTSNVTNMSNMFRGCESLESLNLEKFDMSEVTTTSYMLNSTSALKSLKTPNIYPSDVSIKIDLPRTFIEIDGTESTNKYEKLDNTSPTKTWIYVEVWAKDLSYSNKYTNVGCYDSQCMIDHISNVLKYNDINILADDNLFVTNKGMYIRRSGELILFKINNYTEEYNHIQSVFSDGTCTSLTDATGLRCVASDFHCTVISTGYVDCHDYTTGKSCDISPAGNIHCTE